MEYIGKIVKTDLRQLVLRLQTINDKFEYKNSIVTFLKVSKKRYNQYIRNKEIVWLKLDKTE